MLIQYWADFACPYSYVAVTNLKNAVRELQDELEEAPEVEFEMKAFQLDPDMPKEYTAPLKELFAKKYKMGTSTVEKRIEEFNEMGREAGLEFNYMDARDTNTFDAHRLHRMAREEHGIEERIAERLYHAYFAENLELADVENLVRIAVEEGMEEDDVREMLSSDKYTEEVSADIQEAIRKGIFQIPFFIFDGKFAIPGALSVEQMKTVLMQLVEQQEQLKQRAREKEEAAEGGKDSK